MNLDKLKSHNIEYKAADFKPEIHLLGQIVVYQTKWKMMAYFAKYSSKLEKSSECYPSQTLQSQKDYKDVSDYITYAHPFDSILHNK